MARAIKRQPEWNSPADWSDWVEWLAAGLHGRNRWRLAVVLSGMLFAQGRRTVTSWLRAAGVGVGFARYFYFLSAVGRKTSELADRLLRLLLCVIPCGRTVLLALDDSPTKRYGPK